MNEINENFEVSSEEASITEATAVFNRKHMELTSLIYNNLPYLSDEEIKLAIGYAAAGEEKKLLLLLRHKDNR